MMHYVPNVFKNCIKNRPIFYICVRTKCTIMRWIVFFVRKEKHVLLLELIRAYLSNLCFPYRMKRFVEIKGTKFQIVPYFSVPFKFQNT